MNLLDKLYCTFPHGPYTDCTSSLTTDTPSTSHRGPTTTITFPWWYTTVGHIVKGLKKAYNSLGIQVHFKGSNTICTLPVAPKDKDTMYQKVE